MSEIFISQHSHLFKETPRTHACQEESSSCGDWKFHDNPDLFYVIQACGGLSDSAADFCLDVNVYSDAASLVDEVLHIIISFPIKRQVHTVI